MEKHHQRKLLLIVLWVLIPLILILLAVNAFFVYHLYFAAEPTLSKDDLVNQTLTSVVLTAAENGAEATATPEPPTATPESVVTPQPPTDTPEPQGSEMLYIVKQGDTIINLAESYGIKVEDLRARNQMLGDFLLIDQKLYIPAQGVTFEPALIFSSLDADDSYLMIPQTASEAETTLNIYMEENRFAFQAREQLALIVENSFNFTNNHLAGEAPTTVDVYIASGPFHPESAVRTFYKPAEAPQVYLLHDGSGNLADVNFQLAYGMALLWGEEVWGGSPDAVLREGMAYSMANLRNAGSGNLELCDVAYAYQQKNRLPDLTMVNNWNVEWTRNMVTLSTAGCYYDYLMETYSAEDVQVLYTSGDYAQFTGETFNGEAALFAEWLQNREPSQEMEIDEFVKQMDRLLYLNRIFFADMMSWDYSLETYYNLDQARLSLWRNDVRLALVRMTTAEAMLGLTTHTVELTPTPDESAPVIQHTPGPNETPFATWTPGNWNPFATHTPENNNEDD